MALKPEALAKSQALAFMSTNRAAVGITITKGWGFIIKCLKGGAFSSPVFFTVKQVGVGASIGFNHVDSLLVMKSTAKLAELVGGSVYKFGADLLLHSVGTAAVPPTSCGKVARLDPHDDDLYAMSNGGIIFDISLSGTELSLDAKHNHQLYGDTKLEEVFAGRAAKFEELDPLYAQLSAMVAAGSPEPFVPPVEAAAAVAVPVVAAAAVADEITPAAEEPAPAAVEEPAPAAAAEEAAPAPAEEAAPAAAVEEPAAVAAAAEPAAEAAPAAVEEPAPAAAVEEPAVEAAPEAVEEPAPAVEAEPAPEPAAAEEPAVEAAPAPAEEPAPAPAVEEPAAPVAAEAPAPAAEAPPAAEEPVPAPAPAAP